jgi:hypothetical protein
LTGIAKEHEKIPAVSVEKVDFLFIEDVVAEDESLFMYKLHGNHSTITFELKSLN